MVRIAPLSWVFLLFVLLNNYASSNVETEAKTLQWNISTKVGRTIYMSNLHVQKAKCGRKIRPTSFRLSVSLERDFFRGNTATRGWITTTPTRDLEFLTSLMIDLHREDQVRTVLRWTLEGRTKSWATWERLYQSEVLLTKLLEEDTNAYCMVMYPKILPPSRTFRKDPCDHTLCMDLHVVGTEVYAPESWLDTAPMEGLIAVSAVSTFLMYCISCWITKAYLRRLFYLLFLFPVALVGVPSYVRYQGLQTVPGTSVLLHDLSWGYGEGLSYGTARDQEYHFEAAITFQGTTVHFRSSNVTGMAASREPEEIGWPETLMWPLPPEHAADPVDVTASVTVFADGRPVGEAYPLSFRAAAFAETPQVCGHVGEELKPQFCLRPLIVHPSGGPPIPLWERLPGFGLSGYVAIAFVLLVVFRKRKEVKDEDNALDETEGESKIEQRRKKRD